jgi:hypothetical protein
MPYRDDYERNYENFLKPAVEAANLKPVLAAHLVGPRVIVQDVWAEIKNAFVVLADVTGRNANVLYEVGFAHAMGKPVCFVMEASENPPFDIQHIRLIKYDMRQGDWGPVLKTAIIDSLRSVIQNPAVATNYLFSESKPAASPPAFQDYIAQFPSPFAREDMLLDRSEFAEVRETLRDKGKPLIRYLLGGNVDGAREYLRGFGFADLRKDHLVEVAISALTYLQRILPGTGTPEPRAGPKRSGR